MYTWKRKWLEARIRKARRLARAKRRAGEVTDVDALADRQAADQAIDRLGLGAWLDDLAEPR